VAEPIILSWSGGKDCLLSLYELSRNRGFHIHSLLATVNFDYDRISIHGVRRVLLEKQAAALGYPLAELFISKNASNDEYEKQLEKALNKFLGVGVSSLAFGDIFLDDLRAYREKNLANLGFKAGFPSGKQILWN
jgi:diphthamide synthase (EF-2-diphthine--ammonia ligase)